MIKDDIAPEALYHLCSQYRLMPSSYLCMQNFSNYNKSNNQNNILDELAKFIF